MSTCRLSQKAKASLSGKGSTTLEMAQDLWYLVTATNILRHLPKPENGIREAQVSVLGTQSLAGFLVAKIMVVWFSNCLWRSQVQVQGDSAIPNLFVVEWGHPSCSAMESSNSKW